MIKKQILKLLNPINWMKAYSFHKKNKNYDKSSYDLELYLYSKILRSDMLHYGYFEDPDIDPETISLKQIEEAQIYYAQKIVDLISDKKGTILDVGCGMGGLSGLLLKNNFSVEALTPNKNQIQYIKSKYKNMICHRKKFEKFSSDKKCGTIINSESLQYINLDDAFNNVDELLMKGGRWIIIDYFRNIKNTKNRSGHILEEFYGKVKDHNWKIIIEEDVSKNVLPTIKFVNLYADRFLLPLKHFVFEKLRYKQGWLYYFTRDLKEEIDKKIDKELASVDPENFLIEKKYMLFVIEK